MFVIDSEGNIHEGIAISNQEQAIREDLVALLHEKICGSYKTHSDYSRRTEGVPKCEVCANIFVTKFELKSRNGVDLVHEIAIAASENATKAMEE